MFLENNCGGRSKYNGKVTYWDDRNTVCIQSTKYTNVNTFPGASHLDCEQNIARGVRLLE